MNRRWVAAGVAAVVVVGAVVAVRAARSDDVDLPAISADRLAASAVTALARDPDVSGDLRLHLDLGLPDLGAASLFDGSAVGFLLGDHTIRLWRSPFGARISVVEPNSEQGVYLGNDGAWAWDFGNLSATRLAPAGIRTGLFPLDLLVDEDMFRGLLHGLEPTTRVFVDGGVRVAGRDAYRLALEPRTDDTLVGRVEIDVDAEQRIPLAARVYPRGSSAAALSLEFTSVSYDDVDPAIFDFTPPDDARISDRPSGTGPLALLGIAFAGATGAAEGGGLTTRSFGHDWASVVAIRWDESLRIPDDLTRFIPFSGPLVSVRQFGTSRGVWLLVGAVPPKTLERIGEQEFAG